VGQSELLGRDAESSIQQEPHPSPAKEEESKHSSPSINRNEVFFFI